MMQAANIMVVRIAGSTWGTLEPRPGVFDLGHVDRILGAMRHHGIERAPFGYRQNMDITDPDYRAAAERVIVAPVDHVRAGPNVIGFQLDNEARA